MVSYLRYLKTVRYAYAACSFTFVFGIITAAANSKWPAVQGTGAFNAVVVGSPPSSKAETLTDAREGGSHVCQPVVASSHSHEAYRKRGVTGAEPAQVQELPHRHSRQHCPVVRGPGRRRRDIWRREERQRQQPAPTRPRAPQGRQGWRWRQGRQRWQRGPPRPRHWPDCCRHRRDVSRTQPCPREREHPTTERNADPTSPPRIILLVAGFFLHQTSRKVTSAHPAGQQNGVTGEAKNLDPNAAAAQQQQPQQMPPQYYQSQTAGSPATPIPGQQYYPPQNSASPPPQQMGQQQFYPPQNAASPPPQQYYPPQNAASPPPMQSGQQQYYPPPQQH